MGLGTKKLANGQPSSLYGNAGVRKTAILRLLTGLKKAEKSFIEVDNKVWDITEELFILRRKRHHLLRIIA